MTKPAILFLFDTWNQAVQTGEPKKVTALYDVNAVLLPTISNQVRRTHDEIEDYFVTFLALGPKGEIDNANIRIFGDMAVNSGVYTFSFSDGAVVQARYTFVYRKVGQQWLIIEHHSSRMPE